jgi:hypothetical protein
MTLKWRSFLGLAWVLTCGLAACGGAGTKGKASDAAHEHDDTDAAIDASVADDAGEQGGGGPHDGGGHSMPDAAVHDDAGGGTTLDLRLNHLQVTGTHNSYHVQTAYPIDASHKYTHKPLDQQLEGGVRTLELDLHAGDDGMLVYHIFALDQQTTCTKLFDCLTVIKGWSDAHPKHTPIFVWFEIKNDTSAPVVGKKIEDVGDVDTEVRAVFPENQIITPAFVQSHYASLRDRVVVEGWPKLTDVAGKIMFVLLNRDDLTKGYTHEYKDLTGRLMFANTTSDQFELPWAVITKIDDPNDGTTAAAALSARMLVCTNVCSVDKADDVCEANLSAAVANGFHMLEDDLPFPIDGRSYYLHLPMGSPGCNPATAPAGCTAAMLE